MGSGPTFVRRDQSVRGVLALALTLEACGSGPFDLASRVRNHRQAETLSEAFNADSVADMGEFVEIEEPEVCTGQMDDSSNESEEVIEGSGNGDALRDCSWQQDEWGWLGCVCITDFDGEGGTVATPPTWYFDVAFCGVDSSGNGIPPPDAACGWAGYNNGLACGGMGDDELGDDESGNGESGNDGSGNDGSGDGSPAPAPGGGGDDAGGDDAGGGDTTGDPSIPDGGTDGFPAPGGAGSGSSTSNDTLPTPPPTNFSLPCICRIYNPYRSVFEDRPVTLGPTGITQDLTGVILDPTACRVTTCALTHQCINPEFDAYCFDAPPTL